jgi:hypothetical protein
LKFPAIFVIVLLALCTFASCKQGQEKPPVPQDKMSSIILDLQLAETYSQGLGDSVKNRFEKNTDSLAVFYTSVLKHHKMSFEEFQEAFQWYKDRPMLLDSLYSHVLTRLVEIKAKRHIKDTEEDPVVPDVPTPRTFPEDTAMAGKVRFMKPKTAPADTAKPAE